MGLTLEGQGLRVLGKGRDAGLLERAEDLRLAVATGESTQLGVLASRDAENWKVDRLRECAV